MGIPYNGVALDLGTFEYDPSSIKESIEELPNRFNLRQNYTNPFTEICYRLPFPVDVDLSVFDISERCIKTLVREKQLVDQKSVKWNGRNDNNMNASSGIYFYKLRADGFFVMRKMLLIR